MAILLQLSKLLATHAGGAAGTRGQLWRRRRRKAKPEEETVQCSSGGGS